MRLVSARSFATLRSGACCPLSSFSTWSGLRMASGRLHVMVSTLVFSCFASSWTDLIFPFESAWYHFQLFATHRINFWFWVFWGTSLKMILFLFPTLRGFMGKETLTASLSLIRTVMDFDSATSRRYLYKITVSVSSLIDSCSTSWRVFKTYPLISLIARPLNLPKAFVARAM